MKKRRFHINGNVYEIPENEVGDFLKDNPHAEEVRNYNVNGKEYEIPLAQTDAFESDMGLKKKDGGGSESPSVPPSTSEVKDIFSKVRQLAPEQKQGAMPTVHGITQAQPAAKPLSQEEITKEATKRIGGDSMGFIIHTNKRDPLNAINTVIDNSNKQLQEQDQDPFNVHNINEYAINNEVKRIANEHFFSSGADANDYLTKLNQEAEKTGDKSLLETQTAKAALQKVNDTQRFRDDIQNGGIELALIRDAHPEMAQQEAQNYIDKQPTRAGKEIFNGLNSNPELKAMVNENPTIAKQYNDLQNNFVQRFPKAGQQQITEQISQALEDNGNNNGFINGRPSQDLVEGIIGNLKSQGKWDASKDQLFRNNIQPILQNINRGGFFNSFRQGGASVIKGVGHSLAELPSLVGGHDLTNSLVGTPEQIAENQAQQADVNPATTAHRVFNKAGDLTGFISGMAATGGLLKGLGMAKGSADALNGYLTFYSGNKEKAMQDHPDNPKLQELQAQILTVADAGLTHLLEPGEKFNPAKKEITEGVSDILNKLDSGAITAADAKQGIFSHVLDVAKKYSGSVLKNNAKTSAIMEGFNAIHQGVDAAFGNASAPKSFDEAAGEDAKDYVLNFLGSTPLSAMGALGVDSRTKGAVVREAISDPQFENHLSNSDLPEDKKQDILKNYQYGKAILGELDKPEYNLTQAQKDKYLLHSLAQSVHEKNAAEAKSGGSKAIATEAAQQAEQVQKDILTGKDAAPEHQNIAPVEEEKPAVAPELEKARTELQNTLADPEKSKKLGMYAELAKDNPDAVIKDIAEQAHGITQDGSELTGGSREADMNKNYPELVQAAKEAFPKESYPEPANYTPEEKAKQVMSDYGKLPAESRKTNVTYDGIDGSSTTKTAKDATIELRARYQLLKDVMENCL